MPTMPKWAEGARIVFDTQYPLAFVRRGRRALWEPYAVVQGDLRYLGGPAQHRALDRAREAVLKAVGESIQTMVLALHPGARHTHLYIRPGAHTCGAPYEPFKTTDVVTAVTCPLCLAIVAEDAHMQATKVGPKAVEAAREHVRTVRAVNALGQVVAGEDATERL